MALSVTPTDEMKTLKVGEKIYEIVDDEARTDLSSVKTDLLQLPTFPDLYKAFPTDTASGAVASFADGANVPVKSLIVNIDPVQEGSGAPSHTNVRPISGWSEVNVETSGKNLLAKPFIYYLSVNASLDECFFIKSGTYMFHFDSTNATSWRFLFRVMDKNGNLLTDSAYNPNSGLAYYSGLRGWLTQANITIKYIPITIVKDCYIRIMIANGDTSASTTVTGAQLELGTTPTAYEPYSGQSINIALGQTVYGGTLDVVSGELVIDRAMVDATTLAWAKPSHNTNPNGTYFVVSGVTVPFYGWMSGGRDYAISNALTKASINGTENNEAVNSFWWNNARTGYRCIWGTPNGGSTIEEFLTFIQQNSVVFVGKLATPITVTLTPNELSTLLGANNIWSDAGEVTAEYRADPTLFIQKKIAEAISALS